MPLVATFLVAETTVTEGVRPRALVSVLATAAMVIFDPGPTAGSDVAMLILTSDIGFFIGFTMRWQMRALAAERRARAQEAERATLAERQRIAREIHDLVAHSLSVTMLHVGGARQALVAGDDGVPTSTTPWPRLPMPSRSAGRRWPRSGVPSACSPPNPPAPTPCPCAEDIPELVGRLRTPAIR